MRCTGGFEIFSREYPLHSFPREFYQAFWLNSMGLVNIFLKGHSGKIGQFDRCR
jgi:hypothetical protein